MIKLGSLFSGIGGFELGAQMAFDDAGILHKTLWQVEQNKFCQKVLAKHWPDSKIYDDVRAITKDNVDPVDVLMAGFPCQDISTAGLKRGIYEGEKSSLWWEVWRLTRELRPRVLVLENVANIVRLGGADVLGSLASIGYDAEWSIISAKQFGAPHLRERWFCVAYTNNRSTCSKIQTRRAIDTLRNNRDDVTYSTKENVQESSIHKRSMEPKIRTMRRSGQKDGIHKGHYWRQKAPKPVLCDVDDGISDRVARLKALGNAIVPQCSQYIFERIIKSGLLDEF